MKLLLKLIFLFSIWLAIIGAVALFYYFQGLPSLDDLEKESGKQIVQINYANGNRLTNRSEIYASEVSYYELPRHLINAVVATEDRRFFSHHGVDVFGVIRAYAANKKAGRIVQGGSTVTQQLAKLLFLSSDRTFKRKIQEVLLALQLERRFTKEQILTFYLNRAYFGAGNHGVGNAAKSYFGKDVSQLSLRESALLAGLLKAPSKLSPKNNRELAENRTSVVLRAMIAAGFLDEKNLSELDQDPHYITDHGQRLYFADFVYDQLPDFLGKKEAKGKMISVNTTLDESVQTALEEVLNKFTEKNSNKLGKSEVAVVVMNKSGAVLAMSGGKDHQQSQFNRAVYAKRQAGSAFKTFVYLAAFEKGWKSEDEAEDRKINVGTWLPDNYNSKFLGKVTLQKAFAESLNSVAIQLARDVGGSAVASMARKCGIISKIDKSDPTIALGTTEVTLLELTGAYATVASGGNAIIPNSITEIKNGEGQELYKYDSSGLGAVASENSIAEIRKLLRAVVESGTGKNANVGDDVFGKTGTSQNFRDAWFLGFNSDYVIGVWIGNDDNSATPKITGGSLPAQLFGEILKKI
ncbi:MAG: PBP1A family penicillin-binding protein [Proteobacteria bacterium]|nr:PBP1A family penicillin-binding protein [Pseudomonadota bacterium]